MNALVRIHPDPETAMIIIHADQTAARYALIEYRSGLAPHTIRRQTADLRCFTSYLVEVGIAPSGDLATDPSAWSCVSWGLVAAFRLWLLTQGYAIGTVNTRLATIKAYCHLAYQVGV